MRPKRSAAARPAASASAALVTSSVTASTSLDVPRTFDTRSRSRPEATTEWPGAHAALTNSTPRPRPAPVINQTFVLITSLEDGPCYLPNCSIRYASSGPSSPSYASWAYYFTLKFMRDCVACACGEIAKGIDDDARSTRVRSIGRGD